MGDKWTLMSHQTYALELMADNPAMGLFQQMGTGKTLIALTHAYRRVQRKNFKNILIVCPASLVTNWYGALDDMKYLEEVTPAGLRRLKEAVTIRSYQKMYSTHKMNNGRKKIMIRPDIDRNWDIFIVDESHSIGSHSSIQSKAAYTLATHSRERYILTGTPVHGGGGKSDYSKLYGQIRVLEPTIWKTWKEFCNKYVTHFDRFFKPDAYNIPACKALMENHAIVCRIEDVIDMPEKREILLKCALAEPKIYKDVKKGAIEQYDLDPENIGMSYTKLLQICSGSMKTDKGLMKLKSSKDDVLAELLNGTEDKVVIFCTYTASIHRCLDICLKNKRKPIIVSGETKPSEKGWWKTKFQEGNADVCICQYMSGGAGLNLQKSHTLIFFEPHSSALQYVQAASRIYRKGQKNNCLYYILSTPGTVEEKAWIAVREGVDVTEKMLDKWAREEE